MQSASSGSRSASKRRRRSGLKKRSRVHQQMWSLSDGIEHYEPWRSLESSYRPLLSRSVWLCHMIICDAVNLHGLNRLAGSKLQCQICRPHHGCCAEAGLSHITACTLSSVQRAQPAAPRLSSAKLRHPMHCQAQLCPLVTGTSWSSQIVAPAAVP